MKRLFFILLFLPCFCFAQDTIRIADPQVKRTFLRLEPALAPAIGHETHLSKRTTILNRIGTGWRIEFFKSGQIGLSLWPAYMSDLRYYFTMKLREKKGKYTYGPSANYIAIKNNLVFGSLEVPIETTYHGINIGMQRMGPTNWYFDGSTGVGVYDFDFIFAHLELSVGKAF